MTQIDEFRSSLELLSEDKKRKLAYYIERIIDYEARAKKTKETIARLDKSLASTGKD
jgi:hypothetical protein